jgi:alcohol dehydrogenase class IV
MHALSHPVGAVYDTHHGMTNATFMPYVLQFNRPAIEERITRLAAYMGLPNPGFDSFLAFVLKMREDIGVPHTLGELGVDDSKAGLIAEMAIVDPSAGGNPVPLDLKGAAAIFLAASQGRL